MIFRSNGFRKAKEKIIPDGLMSIEFEDRMQSVAVELELTQKHSIRYDQTFRKYADKEDIHAIWYVTSNEGTLQHIYRRWRKAKTLWRMPTLYLSLIDEVMSDPLNARLRGEKGYCLGDLWKPKQTAHSPAQGVSSQEQKIEHGKIDLSAEDHTPILDKVS